MDPRDGLSDALLASLRVASGRDSLTYARAPAPLAGARSAALYTFALEDAPAELHGPLVARFPPDAAAARREGAFQSAVGAAGYPAPRIRVAGESDSGPYLVMDFVAGKTPMAAAGITGVPKLFRELPAQMAALMADLHAVAVPAGIDAGSGVDVLLAEVEDEDHRAWLVAHRPDAGRVVICHGDLHGENLLVADGAVVAVLDWELAAVAPAELDVARTALILELLPGVSPVARRVLGRAGARSARMFVDAYAERAPLDRDALAWYDALHAARLLAVGTRDGAVAQLWRPLRKALSRRLVRAAAGE